MARNGGDLYIYEPLNQITLNSHEHMNSIGTREGGSIYYYD